MNRLQDALESLEELRVELLQIEATDANRDPLDKAYMAVKTAIEQVAKLSDAVPLEMD